MDVLLSFVLVVFGILQVILFFKLWGMTNDVADIKKHLQSKEVDDSGLYQVKECLMNGESAEAEEELDKIAEKLATDIMYQKIPRIVAKESFVALEAQYKAMGKDMPEFIMSVKNML